MTRLQDKLRQYKLASQGVVSIESGLKPALHRVENYTPGWLKTPRCDDVFKSENRRRGPKWQTSNLRQKGYAF